VKIDVDQFIAANLKQLTAPLKRATVFGPAGRWQRRRTGERVILGPDGTPIRIVQYVDGGTAVEHGIEHRSVVARPQPLRVKLNLNLTQEQ